GLRGLENFGLSCCINALLQAFSATPKLHDLLERWTVSDTEGLVSSKNVPLQLKKVLQAMRSNTSQSAVHLDFLKCLDQNKISFCIQHDADEVFLAILNFIERQMTDKNLAQEIRCLFRVTLADHLQCMECMYSVSETTCLLSLPVPLWNGDNDLEHCLKSFFEPHDLTDEDKVYCEKCGRKQPSKQGFRLISLPPVLCLHLKRFRSSFRYAVKKLSCKVRFPQTLDFKQIVGSEQVQKQQAQYALYAVIVHSGIAMSGHYTAYIRHGENQLWHYADDSHVCEVTWEDVKQTFGGFLCNKTAYMLMYKCVEEDLHFYASRPLVQALLIFRLDYYHYHLR
ncbi:ubl carboxyl-terminal hydrolase 18-like isoform X1, partial [Arapaima gigas]